MNNVQVGEKVLKIIQQQWNHYTDPSFLNEQDEEEREMFEKFKAKGFDWFLTESLDRIDAYLSDSDFIYDMVDE